MQPTDEQVAAITTEGRALIVEAGAGTGKTQVLVERFLHLLAQHPDWPLEGITCITFTEKATREMRTRLRQAIEVRAAAEDRTSTANLQYPIGTRSPTSNPQSPISNLQSPTSIPQLPSPWSRHRRDLDRLQVYTIHGLCARLLRENAIAAGIDPRFAVLDEQAADALKEGAVSQALAALADEDSPVLALLAGLRVAELQDELWALLSKRGAVQRAFDELPGREALLERWRGGAAEMLSAAWSDLLRSTAGLAEALADLPTVAITARDDVLASAVLLAREGCRLLAQGDIAGAAAQFAGVNLRGGRADNWGGKPAMDEIKAELRLARDALVKGLVERGYTAVVGPADEAAADALALWRSLWQRTIETYTALKDGRQALDFDDLELLAERLLHAEPRDERLAAYLAGIRHLMVDEFQDTNEIQGRIVYALAHPSDGGRLFAVGDAKQSIYRFRQAQVSVFYRTAQDIECHTGHGPLPLARSFRTHAALLAALNDAFDALFQPLGARHQDFEARPGRLDAERPGEAPAPEPHLAAPAPVELLLLPRELSAEEARLTEAGLLARRLLALQRDGVSVWDKKRQAYRPFQFADAAILFRSTTDFPLYEEQFKAAGLPYLTVSGRGYYDLPEVRYLLNLLACLYAPGDDLSLATVLRSPLFSLSDETLYRLRWYRPDGEDGAAAASPVGLAQALASPPATHQEAEVAFAAATLAELWGLAGRVDVWQLLRTACDRTGYEAALAFADGYIAGGEGRQRSNVAKFLEMARRYGTASLSGFLRQIRDLRAREAREGEALGAAPETGAVQLMSIHAAKGLEFPVVAVADLGRGPGGGTTSPRLLHDPAFGLVCQQRDANGDWQKPAGFRWAEWLDGRLSAAESKRLLYVACTRAADLLLLSGKPGETGCWMNALLDAWGLPPAGEEEETIARDGYTILVRRATPEKTNDGGAAGGGGRGGQPTSWGGNGPDASALPPGPPAEAALFAPLARPLPASQQHRDLSLSQLLVALRRGEDEDEDVDVPHVRPGVRRGNAGDMPGAAPVPGYVIGRIVHHALAEWLCLDWPEDRLAERLRAWARRERVSAPEAVRYSADRAGRILAAFRRSPLYAEICGAERRAAEVPFTLATAAGSLSGTIDLLYQDRGEWRLVDWKTMRAPPPALAPELAPGGHEALMREHYLQLAAYVEAAAASLGVRPGATICFLTTRRVVSWAVPDDRLAAAWREIVG